MSAVTSDAVAWLLRKSFFDLIGGQVQPLGLRYQFFHLPLIAVCQVWGRPQKVSHFGTETAMFSIAAGLCGLRYVPATAKVPNESPDDALGELS
jgi:hypothetical protein